MTGFQSRDIPGSGQVPQATADIPLQDMVEFAENPEPRCPCVLILDNSGSMRGRAIRALNEGVQTFRRELRNDTLAALRVEVAIITFDGKVPEKVWAGIEYQEAIGPDGLPVRNVDTRTYDELRRYNTRLIQDFVTADKLGPPELKADSSTYIVDAINRALDIVESRKRKYRDSGIAYYRPWVILITDGELIESQEDIDAVSQRLGKAEEDRQLAFFAIGVEGADMEQLAQLSPRAPLPLRGLAFNELFIWLSASMSRVSSSRPGDEVQLDVDGLKDWAAM